MFKSICIEKLFTEHPFYQRFEKVREAGFSHLEFGTWAQHDLGRVRELLERYGLKLACISGDKDYNLIHPADRGPFLEYLELSMEAARLLGCNNLVLHSNALAEDGAMNPRGGELSLYTRVAAATRALLEAASLAERAGVTLLLEPVSTYVKPGYFMHTTPSAGDLIRVVHSPALRLLYDVYHMQLMEGNLLRTLQEYGDIIGYVHIGDAPERTEPGTGEINFNAVKRLLLEELGYQGGFGFELYPSQDLERCLEAIRSF